jgi:hypothetical protein
MRQHPELTFHDGINRAAFLAQTTVDALRHIDIVSGGPPASILTLLGLNCDGLGRANSLTQLAGNATLLPCWISSEGVFPAKPWGDGAFLERVVYRVPEPYLARCSEPRRRRPSLQWQSNSRWPEELFQRHPHSSRHLHQQEVLPGFVERALARILLPLPWRQPETRWRGPCWSGGPECGRGEEGGGRG